MACTVAEFRIRFPEFADDTTYPDARVQLFLDDAALIVKEDCWGDLYDQGVCYLAAHNLWIASQTAASGGDASTAGPIRSAQVGQKSYTRGLGAYDSFDSVDTQLASTPYGLKYLELRGLIRPRCNYMVVGSTRIPNRFCG